MVIKPSWLLHSMCAPLVCRLANDIYPLAKHFPIFWGVICAAATVIQFLIACKVQTLLVLDVLHECPQRRPVLWGLMAWLALLIWPTDQDVIDSVKCALHCHNEKCHIVEMLICGGFCQHISSKKSCGRKKDWWYDPSSVHTMPSLLMCDFNATWGFSDPHMQQLCLFTVLHMWKVATSTCCSTKLFLPLSSYIDSFHITRLSCVCM
jgi:hypothetical protein